MKIAQKVLLMCNFAVPLEVLHLVSDTFVTEPCSGMTLV